ncbi:MAG: glycosyltransferase family 9 protein, partial [Bacteroidota bacterium]
MQPNSHRLKHFFLSLLKLIISPKRPSDAALRSFDRILVVRQHDQLGDMLCVVPLLRGLRQRYAQAHIALMTSPVNHDVMLNNPYVNQVIKYDKRDFLSRSFIRFGALWRFVRKLREEKFELGIVPSTVSMSVTSDLLGYLFGAQYRIGAEGIDGVENPSGVFFNVPVTLDWRADPHRHQSLRNLDIARPLGLQVTDMRSCIGLMEEEVEQAKAFVSQLGLSAPIIVFHPGAGKLPNRWPAERFARVADTLARELNAAVLITHGPMDDGPVT